MDRMVPPDVPIDTAAKQVLVTVQESGATPERWEVLFGEGAMEALARAGTLRVITGLRRIYDLPVTFPERPGLLPDAVSLMLYADRGGGSARVPVSSLLG